MRIEVFTIAWNEEENIKQFLDHYAFADLITVYDNHSTDRTVEICMGRGCKIIEFGNGQQNNMDMLAVKQASWMGSEADWVIVCDVDEIFYHENGVRTTLRSVLQQTDTTIIQAFGYNMVSEKKSPWNEIKQGVREIFFDKCVCFRPSEIKNMMWQPGCHNCNPQGNVVTRNEGFLLLHYKMIGRQETLSRWKAYCARMSRFDLINGYGIEYTFPPEVQNFLFTNNLAQALEII